MVRRFFRTLPVAILLTGLMAASSPAPDAAQAAESEPTVVVTPGTDLRQGDTIRVAAAHFAPNTPVVFSQCVVGAVAPSGCRALGTATTGNFGAARLRATAATVLIIPNFPSATADCRTLPCSVVATQGARSARSFIEFAEPANPKRLANPVFPYVDRRTAIKYGEAVDHEDGPVDLLFDVYTPSGDARRNRPAVIWIFGGGFVAGDREQLRAFAEDSARRGFVAFAIDYRTSASVPIAQAIVEAYQDSTQAARFFRAHARDYGVDANRIFAAGYSAGAINALNLAYGPDSSGGNASLVRGAVSIAGFTPFAPEAGEPPSVMFHGDADTIVPYAVGRSTCDRILAAGVECVFYTYPGEGHGFGYPHFVDINDRAARSLWRWSQT